VLPWLPRILGQLLHPSLPDPFATYADFPSVAEVERFDAQLPMDTGQEAMPSDGDQSPDRSAELESSDQRYRRILLTMGRSRLESSIDFQRQVFGEVMNYWLELARVQPHLDWTSERPAMQLGTVG
jgi:hypothetical protein